jgi:omega-amidase
MNTLSITIIQPDLHWEAKKENLDMLGAMIGNIAEKTEVIVLPEMFTTGFSMNPTPLAETMEGDAIDWMKKTAAAKNSIITGSLIIEGNTQPGSGNKKYFNRLIWTLPNGQYGYYDKRHLFAYAGEQLHYQAGNKRLIASVKGWKVQLLVCYDLRFPVWSRQSSISQRTASPETREPEYDVLIYVANWPQKRHHAWRTLLQARAIENQCYVVGVNRVGEDGNGIRYSGGSMIIDALGEIVYEAKDAVDIFTYTLEKEKLQSVRTHFPFWKSADPFTLNDH